MSDDKDGSVSDNVLVFRNSGGEPVVVPDAVATKADRVYRCYKLRTAGRSWAEIAVEEQYPNAAAAMTDVQLYMAEAQSLIVEKSARDMLTLEVTRLDALQFAVWETAMKGSIPAVKMAMDIIKTRAQLVGLDADKMGDEAERARTVVVPNDSIGYIAALMAAAATATPAVPVPDPAQ